MKLLFDARYTRIDRHDGISRFTAELARELAKLHPVELLISDERQLALLPALPWHLVSAPTSPLEPLVAREVNRLRPDVVFSPMQTMGSLGRRYRLILTVHDLIYYAHRTPPRSLPWYVRLVWRLYHLAWWPQRMLLNGADAIVTVSDTTRRLIERHRLTKRPVHVVGNAAAEPPAWAAAEAPGHVPDRAPRRIVHMGQFLPYKNVDAIARAAEHLPGYEVHFMSRATDAEKQRLRMLAGAAADRLVFHDGASDDEYAGELLRATALVTTSWDEGFGIPVVEAMRLGVPVVASDIPIFREIGADAAVYVDPADPADVARGIRSLEDSLEWHGRSRSSAARAAAFNWARSARLLLDAVEQTLGEEAERL